MILITSGFGIFHVKLRTWHICYWMTFSCDTYHVGLWYIPREISHLTHTFQSYLPHGWKHQWQHGQIKCPDLYSQSVQYRFVVEVQVIKINLGRTQFIICYALKRTLPLFIATSVIPLGSRICEGDRSSLGPFLVSLSLSTSRIGDDDRWHFSFHNFCCCVPNNIRA